MSDTAGGAISAPQLFHRDAYMNVFVRGSHFEEAALGITTTVPTDIAAEIERQAEQCRAEGCTATERPVYSAFRVEKASIGTDLSPDAEVGTNQFGGKSTKLLARFDLLDPQAIQNLARLAHGQTPSEAVARGQISAAILNAYRFLRSSDPFLVDPTADATFAAREARDALEFVQFCAYAALARSLDLDTDLSPDGPCYWSFDALASRAIFHLAEVLGYGAAKYTRNNWRAVPTEEHLNHMLTHCFAYLSGDTQDDHLGHAFCRAHMALAVHYQGAPWVIDADGTPRPQERAA